MLIGLVCLIRTICRKHLSPRTIYLLWLPVLVRLLLPVLPVNISLEVPAGMERLLQMPYIWMEQAVGYRQVSSCEYMETADGIYAKEQSAGTGESKKTNGISVAGADIFAGVWLLGSVFFGIGAVVSNRKLYRYVKGSRKQSVRLGDILPDCNVDLPVVVCDEVSSPCLVGAFRPCILVDSDVIRQPDLLYYSLLHEMTHYKRRDSIWTFLRVLVCIVYWWNPLVWMASRMARLDCELACDSCVIAGLGAEKKKEYGTALLRLSMKNGRPAGGIFTTMGITAGGTELKRRIKGITQETRTKQYVLFPTALMIAVVFLAGCDGKTDRNGIEDNAAVYESAKKDDVVIVEQEKTEEIVLDFGFYMCAGVGGSEVIRDTKCIAGKDGKPHWVERIKVLSENSVSQYIVGEDGEPHCVGRVPRELYDSNSRWYPGVCMWLRSLVSLSQDGQKRQTDKNGIEDNAAFYKSAEKNDVVVAMAELQYCRNKWQNSVLQMAETTD